MSLIDTFDSKTEEIVKPSSMLMSFESVSDTVVAAFQREIVEIAINRYGAKQIGEMSGYFSTAVYDVKYKGVRVTLYQTIPGAPLTVSLLERFIAKGGRKFIFFGSCGVLDADIAAGRLIVPTAAYRDEGTSYHYAPPGDYQEIRTANKLTSILNTLDIPYVKGKTWTTDAIFRETRGNMLKRKNDGCLTVEMECAAIMAAAQFRDVDAYQFLYAADNLDSKEWDRRILGAPAADVYETCLLTALEIAVYI
jgi:uridine phosphorylase